MGFLGALFSRKSKAERLLSDGIEQAHDRQPERAIESYSAVLEISEATDSTRASALFNRGLTYAALKRYEEAHQDLQAVIAMPKAPASIRSEARIKLTRMERRAQ